MDSKAAAGEAHATDADAVAAAATDTGAGADAVALVDSARVRGRARARDRELGDALHHDDGEIILQGQAIEKALDILANVLRDGLRRLSTAVVEHGLKAILTVHLLIGITRFPDSVGGNDEAVAKL